MTGLSGCYGDFITIKNDSSLICNINKIKVNDMRS
jgi:hypothetical protein